ncbi:MAG: SDR family NAD(P)-dependent oxidoreductase [Magnetococcales bacterium]|nr:SDR family NAD(P)-dependent oxidoreductase [Magnetococcales bacterium]
MKALVIGASAGLGRALAQQLGASGHELYLVASDQRDLLPLAQDLSLRYGVTVHCAAIDLADLDPDALRHQVLEKMPSLSALFYVAGCAFNQDNGPVPAVVADRLLKVNFTSGARIINAFLDHLDAQPRGLVVGIGAVAAVRARGDNMIYAAAKRGLEFYCAALRHRYNRRPLTVQFYRVGYMLTSMLGGSETPLPAAAPEKIAAHIVAHLEDDFGMRHLPGWWYWVCLVLKLLPWTIFKRLSLEAPGR